MSMAVPQLAVDRAMAGLAATEERLEASVECGSDAVREPARATLSAGGKRLRPLLVFCCSPAERAIDADLVAAAAAVELVHTATLVHDDIIDGAALRRGHPTVVSTHGPARALQVGDFLFARAFAELAGTGNAQAIRLLAATAVDLSRGELAQERAVGDAALTEATYMDRCRQKTASLFATACQLGAALGGVSDPVRDRMGHFGTCVGLAFQIFDDILDITGDTQTMGKQRGADLRDGTITLPMILSIAQEPALAERVRAVGDDASIDALCDDLRDHPGTHAARLRAKALIDDARRALDGPMDGIDPAPLYAIADGVVDRYS